MPVPSEPPRDVVPLLRIERSRLLDLLTSLTPLDWQRDTPCPGWTVLGLVAHLVGGDLGVISSHRDGHRGTPAPVGLDEAGFIDWLDDVQREWVHAARRISPALMVQLLAFLDEPLAEALAGQDPRARTATVSWAGPEPQPVWLDHARELTERWIHRQQLLQALGRPSDLRPDLAAPVLDTLRWAYPYRLASVDRPPGTSVLIDITGESPHRWLLVRGPDAWTFAPASAGRRPAATLHLSTDHAWRLLTNNHPRPTLEAPTAVASAPIPDAPRPITTAGDPTLTTVITTTRAIIAHPQ